MKLWISLGHTFGHALAKSNDSSAWRRSHMFRTYCDILPQLSLYRTVYQNISNIFSISLVSPIWTHSNPAILLTKINGLAQRWIPVMLEVCFCLLHDQIGRRRCMQSSSLKTDKGYIPIHTRSERLCNAFALWARWYFHIFHGLDVGFWKVVSRCFKYEPGLPAYTKIILAQRSHCLQQYRRAWSLVSCNVERPWLLDMAAICCNIDG